MALSTDKFTSNPDNHTAPVNQFVRRTANFALAKGFQVFRTKLMNPDALETEKQLPPNSMFGTPVFSNLEIPNTVYIDADGNSISIPGITLDGVLFTITQTKNIVTTAIQGRNGTIKEYISDGDYDIKIEVIIASEQNVYPELEVNKLAALLQVPEALKVNSEFLNIFGITDAVVTSFEIPQVAGVRNQQQFSINLISDIPAELDLNEL